MGGAREKDRVSEGPAVCPLASAPWTRHLYCSDPHRVRLVIVEESDAQRS